MALLKSKTTEIPQDAVVLSEKEAVKYQLDIIKNWPKTSQVFCLKYGPHILAGASLLTGAYYNNYFRRKFMLGHYGRMATYLPICFVPLTLSAILHTELVVKDVLLMKSYTCPVCLQSRAAALQAIIGGIYPLIMAPIGCSVLAVRYVTYDMPYITDSPKQVFNIYSKMLSKIQTKTLYWFIAQAFLASIITHFEVKNLFTITTELRKQEEKALWN
ncbi:unnamed protein product [Ceutorhynchus assimilis]|uniref:Transmembrane protein 126A n=1 Tax=Ceutorhynchus assimilis TaxID=467358 RepID=A0A9N9QCV7_9CUCU|nr:unnamed protein product [Ceutorhynchus assimilis]